MPKNILILEDSPAAMAILQAALRNAVPGSALFTAKTIEEAQQIAADHPLHLFVLDIHLPDGTGLEFLTDMKMVHPQAHAIFVTATPLPAYREYAERAGAVSFFAKPIDPKEVRDYVVSLFAPEPSEQSKANLGIRDLTLIDIVQIKCLAAADAVLEIDGPSGEKGKVFFERGQIRHAKTGDVQGIEALWTILAWPGGNFRELPKPAGMPRTILGDWQLILTEAIRRASEAKKTR